MFVKRLIVISLSLLFFYSGIVAAASPRIEIKGITGEALANIKARLDIIEESYGKDRNDFILHAPENIRKALEPFGYFKATVKTQTMDNTTVFIINPGPAVKISNVEVQLTGPGKNNSELQKFIADFPIKPGQVFSADRYNKAKDTLFEIANNEGYLKAALEKKAIQIHLKNNTAGILLHLNTGPRYYFGHVLYGPNPFAPEFLQRFVPFKSNEPFSSQKLQKFQQDLRDSHYFREIEATPNFDQAEDNTVPINVAITPQKSQRYDIGVGYGTYTGPRFTFGTEFRRVTNTGQHFNAKINFSSVLKSISTKYFIPGKNPLTDQYVLGANVQSFSPKNGTSFSQSLSASYEKNKEDWQHSLSLNFLNERYRILNQTTHQSQIFYPSFSLSHLKVDDILSPRFGNKFSFIIQGASQDIFSKTSFLQSEIKAKTIFSPTTNSRVLLRGDLGYTVVENLNQLPLSLRYFAGGINTVRGYPYNTIGPGKYLEVASAEVQHKIIGDWSGAVFYDIGNASNTFNGQFNRGEGVGVIYHSFIGPIQLYAGRAMSKPGKPWSIEFNIGSDF